MIIVKIVGGLGNQMFQYAYAKKLDTLGFEVKIDTSAFKHYDLHGGYGLDNYSISLEVADDKELSKFKKSRLLEKLYKKIPFLTGRTVMEKSLLYHEKYLKSADGSYVDGYFQSEKYFFDIKETLLKEFQIRPEISDYSKNIAKKILQSDTSVSIHIRRGDYIHNPKANAVHGVCSLEYYKKAIGLIEKKFKNPTFFIFSDDIKWSRENLGIKNSFFVENGDRIPHEDIYLMSLCNHNIIANSSFSWWGAWLNRYNKKIVIAPQRWFADKNKQSQALDIIPESWMKI